MDWREKRRQEELGGAGSKKWSGKRIAILYRGHATRDLKGTLERSKPGHLSKNDHLAQSANYTFDYRDIWANHAENVFDALTEAGVALADVYTCLHKSALDEHVLRDLQPLRYHFESNPDSLQGNQIATGLALIDPLAYDLILILRMDLLFKAPVTTWNVDFTRLNVPFRSINDTPNYCTCLVGDTIIGFPPSMASRVVRHCGPMHTNCHGLGQRFDDVHLLVQGQCYNSNTGVEADEGYHVAKNPLYVLYGRYYDYDDAPIPHIPEQLLLTEAARERIR
mmetsp:Transcript_48790/g.66485  ORF Transcript_48790/g.66485 Transcript_48790/m.66485 type:complete len:280 (-) Transcript_48790:73-912(-)